MKKRILISSLITVIFALIIVTCSFIALFNIKEINKTKEILSNYNNILIRKSNFEIEDLNFFTVNKSKVRFTIVDREGNVIKDSQNKELDNHSDREEIIKAFNVGESTVVRYSDTDGINEVYCATKINEEIVIRSSVPISNVKFFNNNNIVYYLFIIILVLILSIALSLKLIRAIIYPLKELEIVTDKIANGDYSKRVNIYTNDEIGSLANTFNNMAEELECRIIDSIDKQNELEAILESMEGGVIAVDNKQKIMLMNPYAKNLFGIKKDIIGENLSEYIIDYDIISFVRSIHEVEAKEIKLIHPIPRELKIRKAPIINSAKIPIGVVVTVLDITDLKRLENIRSEFVANVSHELKTPLTSIKGFAETLKYVEDTSTRNKFLDIIDKESQRLTNLINDILILSNIENNVRMKNEEFNPSIVIEDVVNIFSNEINNEKVDIIFDNKGSKVLIGDRDKFYQMMLNLVQNSIKYSKDKVTINIRTYSNNDYEYIEVEDNGIGIPVEDLPRIFERFYRVDKSRAKGGTGLGLAIVKHIAKMFNGEVYVESIVNKGTKFTIKIRKIKKLNEI